MALKVILLGGRKIGNGQNYEAPPSSIPGAVIQIHSQRNFRGVIERREG